ncbi:Thioredoxin 2 [Candidatus Magnetomoraceae bacterium gMMP-15]
MAETILDVSDGNFDAEIVNAEKPAVVDFWAAWCGPCKAMGPIFEELAGSFGDKVRFSKCNVDDNPVTPSKYGIQAIPTLIFFKDGDVFDRITGMVTKTKIEDVLNKMV